VERRTAATRKNQTEKETKKKKTGQRVIPRKSKKKEKNEPAGNQV